jgi:hypothetical protein
MVSFVLFWNVVGKIVSLQTCLICNWVRHTKDQSIHVFTVLVLNKNSFAPKTQNLIEGVRQILSPTNINNEELQMST